MKKIFHLSSAMIMLFGTSATVLAAPFASPNDFAISRALTHIELHTDKVKKSPNDSFNVKDVIIDDDGSEHVRVDRKYKGLDVVGGDAVLHTNGAGNFKSVSLTLENEISLDVIPSVKKEDAIKFAESTLSNVTLTGKSKAKTIVYARNTQPVLAWDVEAIGIAPDQTPVEMHVIVNATNTEKLDSWNDIQNEGSGIGFFNGLVPLKTTFINVKISYNLKDPTRGGQYTLDMQNRTNINRASDFYDLDDKWGDGTVANRQTVAVDAQYGTAVTWDYYFNVHGRNGIANNGIGASNRVHYGSKYNNAFWSNSCFCMTYGDGDGVTFNPFDSLDVAGHEMTHGVTSKTANLTYSGESGGLNEATSDIFGTMVEFYANNSNDAGDYFIGEKLFKSGTGALRSMSQPSLDTASADCWYSGLGSLDVHYSSGVANHFFYLLAEGTDGTTSKTCNANDTKAATNTTVTLTKIGRDAAAQIWYKALTAYMTSSTNYAGARAATLSAAMVLYPDDVITGVHSSEYKAVQAAWDAVNVH